ncbi:MAG: DUF6106 family protein [Eubacteriales bacterium]|nr:DUF6106 family protein [Eubacteriales bacterium]
MSDLYTELIVKRKMTAADSIKKYLLLTATAVAAVLTLLTGLSIVFLLATIALGVADYFVIPTLDVEFEYLYVNGELDIDKIMSKQKRKRAYSTDISELELLAPSRSHALDYYNNQKNLKTYDFSSGAADQVSYTMIVKKDQGLERVIFEPNDTILKDMKRVKPREVNLD